MLLQKTLLALASCSLFSVAAFAQTPPSPYQNVAASSLQPRHGSPAIPISRQYQCYKEGGYYWPADGSGIPQSDCKAAYQLVYHKYLDKSGIVVPKEEGKKAPSTAKKMLSILSSSPTISSGSGMRPPRMLLTTTIRMPLKPPSRTGSFVPPVMSALNGMSVRKSGMTNPV